MAYLVLHPKWKEAISTQDLVMFRQMVDAETGRNHNTIVWRNARATNNYRNDILATVLIINNTTVPLDVNGAEFHYLEGGKVIAKHHFTIPSWTIEPGTATPWTFIFPANTVIDEPTFRDWALDGKEQSE